MSIAAASSSLTNQQFHQQIQQVMSTVLSKEGTLNILAMMPLIQQALLEKDQEAMALLCPVSLRDHIFVHTNENNEDHHNLNICQDPRSVVSYWNGRKFCFHSKASVLATLVPAHVERTPSYSINNFSSSSDIYTDTPLDYIDHLIRTHAWKYC